MNPYDVNMFYFDLAGNRVRVEKDIDNEGTNPFVADETTTYEYDDNDRLLYELDANGGVIYEYGSNASPMSGYGGDHTTQTSKTIYENGSFVSKTTYLYEDGTGRMTGVEIDTTNDGNPETTISYIYNDDGIRVKKTETINIGEFNETQTKTIYHIDPNNHTGYAQVIEEGVDDVGGDGKLTVAEVDKAYTLGHDVIAQATSAADELLLMYDGHGSTRALLDSLAAIIEQYTYDAYGSMLNFSGDPLTTLLFSGEITDQTTGLQYLRARYYDASNGRFNRLDPYVGSTSDPQSLHKYLYTHANPVMGVDPSGMISLTEVMSTMTNMLHNATKLLRVYAKARDTADFVMGLIDILTLIRGDLINTIKASLDQLLDSFGHVPDNFHTARLFKSKFWEDAAKSLSFNSSKLLANIQARQGTNLLFYMRGLSKRKFRWTIYMPTPSDGVKIPVGMPVRTLLPGAKIGGRKVVLHFGKPTAGTPGGGRIFGIGFGEKDKWHSQLFRMDYHQRHHTYGEGVKNDWYYQGDHYLFNFHTPDFEKYRI